MTLPFKRVANIGTSSDGRGFFCSHFNKAMVRLSFDAVKTPRITYFIIKLLPIYARDVKYAQ